MTALIDVLFKTLNDGQFSVHLEGITLLSSSDLAMLSDLCKKGYLTRSFTASFVDFKWTDEGIMYFTEHGASLK